MSAQRSVLRYPGIDCVLPSGQASSTCGGPGWVYSQPEDDPGLKCPAPPKVPAHFTEAGQQVKICTSSLFFENQTATAMTYFMGYDNGYDSKRPQHLTATWGITDPWNPHTGRPVHTYQSTPCTAADTKWRGNVPFTCALREVLGAVPPGVLGAGLLRHAGRRSRCPRRARTTSRPRCRVCLS